MSNIRKAYAERVKKIRNEAEHRKRLAAQGNAAILEEERLAEIFRERARRDFATLNLRSSRRSQGQDNQG